MDYSATFRCKRRDETLGQADRVFLGKDHWREGKDGTHTCSYCGSMSEPDFIDMLTHYIADDKGYSFDPSTKHYKYYAHKPGVRNAGEGAIKFYTHHIAAEGEELEKNKNLVIEACKKFNAEIDALVNRKPKNGEAERENTNLSDR